MDTVIFILGSKELQILKSRLEKSLEIISNYPSSPIFVSGGTVLENGQVESAFMESWIHKRVPSVTIYQDNTSLDTVQNIIHFYRFFKNIQNIFLITSDFHMKRCLVCLKILFPNVNIISRPCNTSENRLMSENKAIIRDVTRIHHYKKKLKGFL
tara:strand:+ start:721 stop:1185 length:465 start_codon:yes stop_codon:yes gene_type:complete